ncbi:MAG: TPM domain-containing protein [Actinomycetaceae bacterium]|nr:TPM domain-containing protein [Actinomycetaceae bacterium]MDY5854726.1 TPM domain-containing protein [Arcanobacterium sp.]
MKLLQKFAALLFVAVVTAAAVVGTPTVAHAEEPMELTSNFEDHADVVKDDAATLAAVEEVPGKDLWVVMVNNFSGTEAHAWAKRTTQLSGLQKYDGLVAISVEGSEIGYEAGGTGITKNLLEKALSDKRVADAFRAGDWDKGVRQIASNVKTLLQGGSIESKAPLYVLFVLALAVGVVLIVIVRRNAKRKAQADAESLRKLATRASSELVQVDDAVRSASAELEFARAEFGLQATQEFAASLEQAKENMQRAFSLRTLLGDEHPETPAQQRQMNTQILQLADSTRKELQAQEKGFSELRNLAARVEEKVAQLETRRSEIAHQLPLAQAKLDNLALSYPTSMFHSLNSYPEQVEKLLEGVQTSLTQAREQIARNDRNSAVGYAKLAEGTLDNAARMVARIDSAPQLIEQAQAQLTANIQSLSSDVADAQRLGAGDHAIASAQRAAQEALEAARSSAGQDLLALNERLESAEANLDRALTGVREQEQVAIKQAQAINAAKASAQARIDEAEGFINSYRSGIGPDARTYLARARTQFAQALSAPPPQQEQLFRSAATLAKQALTAAEKSIERDHRGQSGDSGMGSFLAGMVISSVLNGTNRGSGGGFSGGSFGGGFGGGSGGGRIGF